MLRVSGVCLSNFDADCWLLKLRTSFPDGVALIFEIWCCWGSMLSKVSAVRLWRSMGGRLR